MCYKTNWLQGCLTVAFILALSCTAFAEPTAEEPYGKGEMEVGASLGGSGGSEGFALGIGASFAYYVINRLAPGLDVTYTVRWGDVEYPQSLTLLPFAKFVLIRSLSFAPYLIAIGGREFQWSGTNDPAKGYAAIGAWIAGGGLGMSVGVTKKVAINMEILALYYFFDETVLISDEDSPVDGTLYFPMISIGVIFRP